MTPVRNPEVTSVYGPRISPITGKSEMHNGEDIIDYGGNRNTYAIFDTIKTEFIKGYNYGRGYTAYLYYGNTLRCLYQHLESFSTKVLKKQSLKQGDTVGVMGKTGDSTGIHLHIEMQELRGGKWTPINPEKYTEVPNRRGRHQGNVNLDGNNPTPPIAESEDDNMVSIYTIQESHLSRTEAEKSLEKLRASSADPKEFIITTLGNFDYTDGKTRIMKRRMKRQTDGSVTSYNKVYKEMQKELQTNEILV